MNNRRIIIDLDIIFSKNFQIYFRSKRFIMLIINDISISKNRKYLGSLVFVAVILLVWDYIAGKLAASTPKIISV